MKITEVSIKRPLSVTMVFLGVILFGFISVTNLPVALFPDVSFPIMIVLTGYPGAGPEEIETTITDPLEQTLGTVNNLDKITSTTSENTSTIILQFDWGTDLDAASNDVRDRLGLLIPYMPDDADYPMIFKFDVSQQPVVMYTIGGAIDPLELDEIAEDIADRVQRVGGVAASYAMSGTFREIQIMLDPIRLKGTGITPDQIIGALQAQNVNYPLGSVVTGKRTYILRTIGQYEDLDGIRNTVVGSHNGVPIPLSQVADVKFQASEQTSISRTNGVPSIWGMAQKRTDANAANVGSAVVGELEKIKKDLPPGIQIDVIFNQADFIIRSVQSTAQTLILGAILAIIILFLFLGSFRSTIYMAIAIPVAVFFALFLMYFFDMSLNIISLGGLTVAIGMVLDSAIVVFESIFRKKEEGVEPVQAACQGAAEVGPAITASTLTTVAVFLPLLLVSGFASIFFRPLALTVTFALVSSLVVALTIIPMLTVRFGAVKRREERTGFSGKLGSFYERVENTYTRLIRWALGHRKTVIFGTVAFFVVSLVLIPFIGTELSPEMDQGEIIINAEMPVGTNLWVTDSVVKKLEAIIIDEVPEIEILSTSIGAGEGGFTSLFAATSGPHAAQIWLELVHREERSRSVSQIQKDLRPKIMNVLPGLKVTYGGSEFHMFGGGSAIEVKIIGYDLGKAQQISEELMDMMQNVEGLVDLESSVSEGKPELRLIVDRRKAANFGLTPYQIGTVLRSRIEGIIASQYRKEGNEYNMRIMLDEANRDDLKKITSMTITTPLGDVPIQNFVKDTIAVGPVEIEHEDAERLVTITADVEGRDAGSAGAEVRRIINSMQIPADFEFEMGGGFEEQMETFRDLFFVIILAVVLVYMIMVGQFESFKEPFIIMFTIPLAIIGVLWMLFFTGTTINMQSLLGVLLLGGIVVNNGIVYITYTNQLRRQQGKACLDAVVEAGRVRLRPILMTAFTTSFGLIPMALGIGAGNELRAPMARSVIGGLMVSTFLTLVFIPVLYTLFERMKKNKPKPTGKNQIIKE
ncbi:MAG: efflux RND transporter permease subunit [candidate division WOR-3 bacterium]|nr:MAG: efflux RND transporter permease subunit [candidate division WOR-3 bacterium]